MSAKILTPLQIISASGLLQNQGLSISPALVASIDAYRSTPLMTAFLQALAQDGSLATLSSSLVPMLSNSVPTAYIGQLGSQLTDAILARANVDFAGGDVSKFIQAINVILSYAETTNIFVNSAINSQTYLGGTFTSMNDLITSDVTSVNLATQAFGQDLANLGQLIDLTDLGNLGSPLALVQRIGAVVGSVPLLNLIFVAEGVPEEVAITLDTPNATATDSVQRLMYQAMTKIQGELLTQILSVLNIKTIGIETMADLLNPVKLFPNSYQSLTTVTANGIRAIYIDNRGTVNSALDTELPAYVLSSTA